ncbi:MAG TPA: ribonuclease HIII [Lactobacillaceae bacterium]|jgi:ribonuclease HIII
MQTVLTLNNLAQIKSHYSAYLAPTPANAAWVAKLPDVTITAYASGKVLFQGKGHAREAALWGKANPTAAKSSQSKGDKIPADFGTWSVMGSDEVGAGAYFGPLTTAAVFVPASEVAWVKQLGIADSKTLNDTKITTMAQEIIARLPHHVVNLMPEKYNELQPKYNVVALKALSHNLALAQLTTKINTTPDAYLIDQFAQRNTYYKYLAGQASIIKDNVYFATKAETLHMAVAAASILARYVELQSMRELSQRAGVTLPIGAGANVDRIAADLLRRGVDLREFAKLHFANTDKAKQML